MTRHCMISSLGGPRGRSHDSSKSHQENVEGMKSFWHGQLKQVLADRPDLVVVPEASDRTHRCRWKSATRTIWFVASSCLSFGVALRLS